MYLLRDSEGLRKILNMKTYSDRIKCRNCNEFSIEQLTNKLYFCSCCDQHFIGVSENKIKKLEEEGFIKSV